MNKRATIKDVAKLAETSVSVVSYVLNETPGKSISEKTKVKVLTTDSSGKQYAFKTKYSVGSIIKNLSASLLLK